MVQQIYPQISQYITPDVLLKGIEGANALQRNRANAYQLDELERQRSADEQARGIINESIDPQNPYMIDTESAKRKAMESKNADVAKRVMSEVASWDEPRKKKERERAHNMAQWGVWAFSRMQDDLKKDPSGQMAKANWNDSATKYVQSLPKEDQKGFFDKDGNIMVPTPEQAWAKVNEADMLKTYIDLREQSRKERETDKKTTESNLPYKVGSLHDIVVEGKTYQATFHGMDEKGEPMWKNLQVKPEKQEAGDKDLIRSTIKEMPKLKKEAMSQSTNIDSIDKALTLLKTGNVTGKTGQLKSFLAPYAEAMGMDAKEMDDAQTFELLTRTIVGPMRLDIIGAGPVSEWEQKLMQKMSGSGGTSQAAALELLTSYRKLAEDKVNNYNATLEGLTQLSPSSSKIYKPITLKGKAKQSTPVTTSKPAISASQGQDPITQLKSLAANGDKKAQSYLKSKGIIWQQ